MITQLITAFLGSMGFAILYGLGKRYIPYASAGGFLCWGVYLLLENQGFDVFVSSLIATICVALYGEICARALKAPAVIFFIPSVIPLIPGRTLYYTVSSIVGNDTVNAAMYATVTAQYALAISSGIGIVISAFVTVSKIREYKGQS